MHVRKWMKILSGTDDPTENPLADRQIQYAECGMFHLEPFSNIVKPPLYVV